jgi:hypothetical protein
MDPDQAARMRRLVGVHAGRKRTMLVLLWRGSFKFYFESTLLQDKIRLSHHLLVHLLHLYLCILKLVSGTTGILIFLSSFSITCNKIRITFASVHYNPSKLKHLLSKDYNHTLYPVLGLQHGR